MQSIKSIFLFFILTLVLSSFASPAYALKKRVKVAARSGGGSAVSFSSAKLSRGTNSVVVTFSHLNLASKINYTLSYSANGVAQGVIGNLVPNGQVNDSRDLYFGTCSKGVCTPHHGIQNAILLVETMQTNGRTNTKRYKIKV